MDGETKAEEAMLAAVFEAGGALIAIDSSRVETIARVPRVTAVRGASAQVLGIANLRGRIITVLDAGKLLGLVPSARDGEAAPIGEDARILVAEIGGESIGVLVERVRDVVEVDSDAVQRSSREGGAAQGELFAGIFEAQGKTIALLDLDKALSA
jgi:Chemotaxis signal transduction protein